jgi:hypothetical protein
VAAVDNVTGRSAACVGEFSKENNRGVKGVARRLGSGLSRRVKLALRDIEPSECI